MKFTIGDKKTVEKPVEQFLKELRVDGRYNVGNSDRVSYLRTHRSDIDTYIDQLAERNSSEARLLSELVALNLSFKSRKRIMDLTDSVDLGSLLSRRRTFEASPASRREKIKITGYDSKPRRRIERLLLPILMAVSIGYAVYIGRTFKTKIEKMISPYAEKIYAMYYDIDHPK